MTLQSGLLLDTTGDLWLLWGMGSPLGDTLSDRGKGSLYLQLDAVPNNFLWAKTNGLVVQVGSASSTPTR